VVVFVMMLGMMMVMLLGLTVWITVRGGLSGSNGGCSCGDGRRLLACPPLVRADHFALLELVVTALAQHEIVTVDFLTFFFFFIDPLNGFS
jgi:hypothetical protein